MSNLTEKKLHQVEKQLARHREALTLAINYMRSWGSVQSKERLCRIRHILYEDDLGSDALAEAVKGGDCVPVTEGATRLFKLAQMIETSPTEVPVKLDLNVCGMSVSIEVKHPDQVQSILNAVADELRHNGAEIDEAFSHRSYVTNR